VISDNVGFSSKDGAKNGKRLRIGVVGTGTWARRIHIPVIADHPNVELSGVWGRRPEATRELAKMSCSTAYENIDQLIDESDAIAFALPPKIQPIWAAKAAKAKRILILEKPIAETEVEAKSLFETTHQAGTKVIVCLLRLFDENHRSWLHEQGRNGAKKMHVSWRNSGMLPGSPFATPWRQNSGALVDVGPHIICQAEYAMGAAISGHLEKQEHGVLMALHHKNGGVTEAEIDLKYSGPKEEKYTFSLANKTVERSISLDFPKCYSNLIDSIVDNVSGGSQVDIGQDLRASVRTVQIIENLCTSGSWKEKQ